MILVAGATGLLGRHLVQELAAAGEQVRAFARGVHPFPAEWPGAVERMPGDLASADDCRRAVQGCDKVVFTASGFGLPHGGDPRSVDRDGAIRLIHAAEDAGCDQFVMMSMHGAAPDGPIDYLRCKYAAEEALKASGMAWTIIRMGALLEQWIDQLSGPLQATGKVMVFGRGDAPVTFTSLADATAIVRRALSDPALRNQVLEWGSEDHSLRELAAALVTRAGRGTVQAMPPVVLRVMSVAARPFSPFLARMTGAAVLIDKGAFHFDAAPTRSRYPDIPTRGLAATLQQTS